MKRRAVIERQRRTGSKARDEPVPHHPAAGREVEKRLTGLQVAMKAMLLQVLEKRAARRMDNAFRDAGRSARIHDVERMREGQANESERIVRRGSEKRRPVLRPCETLRTLADEGHDGDMFERGQARDYFGELVMRGQHLAGIAVTVAGDEHFRLDLSETIEHALHAEIRRAGGENRADAGRGEHRNNGFGTVWHEGGDTVALAHSP